MNASIFKKTMNLIFIIITKINDSSDRFDRTQRQIEYARSELLLKNPGLFIGRNFL